MTEDDSRLRAFYDLSVVLTGFSRVELAGTGLGPAYLGTLSGVVGVSVVDDLLRVWAAIARADGDVDSGLRTCILGDPRFGPVARNLISLWYVGNWYELPQAWRDAYGVAPGDVTRVVSAEAYQEGLMWAAGGAHPQGAREPGYGTWAAPPAADLKP